MLEKTKPTCVGFVARKHVHIMYHSQVLIMNLLCNSDSRTVFFFVGVIGNFIEIPVYLIGNHQKSD